MEEDARSRKLECQLPRIPEDKAGIRYHCSDKGGQEPDFP